jgi:hypothetical protein
MKCSVSSTLKRERVKVGKDCLVGGLLLKGVEQIENEFIT